MGQFHCAQIDGNGTVVGISYLAGKVEAPELVELGADDGQVGIGWRLVGGVWTEPQKSEAAMTEGA